MQTKFQFSGIIAVVTLIISIMALVPAFLSLNKEKAALYWSFILSSYEAPEGIDQALFSKFLKDNNIPTNRFSLQIKNCGNAPSEQIKFSVKTEGEIVRWIFNPSQKENPVWVDVPADKELGFKSGVSNTVQIIKNLSANKLVVFGVGYEGVSSKTPEIEMFSDGVAGNFVSNISEAPVWNPYRVFYLPGYIFVGGLAITLLWILISVILSNPEYRKTFADIGLSVLDGFSVSILNVKIPVKHSRKGTENKGDSKTEQVNSADPKGRAAD